MNTSVNRTGRWIHGAHVRVLVDVSVRDGLEEMPEGVGVDLEDREEVVVRE